MDCCVSELALLKSNHAWWFSRKWTSSSTHSQGRTSSSTHSQGRTSSSTHSQGMTSSSTHSQDIIIYTVRAVPKYNLHFVGTKAKLLPLIHVIHDSLLSRHVIHDSLLSRHVIRDSLLSRHIYTRSYSPDTLYMTAHSSDTLYMTAYSPDMLYVTAYSPDTYTRDHTLKTCIHDSLLSRLGTGTSIKNGCITLV